MKRKRIITKRILTVVFLIIILIFSQASSVFAESDERISTYFTYQGYNDVVYPNYICYSTYVEVPAWYEGAPRSDPAYQGDTVKLALDYVLPADENGNPINGKFDVIWTSSRGGRFTDESSANGGIADYVKHGYAVVYLEMRGCGASFGVNNSFASIENRLDVKYVMENWLPAQSWFAGKIVSVGGSNRGLIQWAVATVAPNGLMGVAPVVNNSDFYYQNYINGVSATPGATIFKTISGTQVDETIKSYEEWKATTTTKFVDEDPNGIMAYEAYVYQTQNNRPFTTYMIRPNICRDYVNPYMYDEQPYLTIPPVENAEAIIEAGLDCFSIAGYYDTNCAHQIAAANAYGEGRLIIGPWGHREAIRSGDLYLRWFDYLLKGVDNGFDETPRFYYYLVNAPEGHEWRYSESLPLQNTKYTDFYLGNSATTGINLNQAVLLNGEQSNNGVLSYSMPSGVDNVDYTVDTNPALPEEWNDYWITCSDDLVDLVDVYGLTFTSEPVKEATQLFGVADAHIWISSEDVNDIDLVCYYEVVHPDGTSNYLARSLMRASHRTKGENILWDSTEGMAGYYHTSLTADVEACLEEGLNEPVLLEFISDWISYELQPGDSLRFTVTCYEDSYQNYMLYDEDGNLLEEMPQITVYTGGEHASYLSLPIVISEKNVVNGTVTMYDDSFTGPGTLYMFDENVYLYCNGRWHKYPVADNTANYTVLPDGRADFYIAGFCFQAEGELISDGIEQDYKGGNTPSTFPTTFATYNSTRGNSYTYAVKAGDTLWDIARIKLGNGFKWIEIYNLNTSIIFDPNFIDIGQVLILPHF